MSIPIRKGRPYRRWIFVAVVVTTVAAVLNSASCGPTPPGPFDQRLATATGPARHAVFSDELRLTMRNLERRHMSQMRAELYSGDKFRPNMENVASEADALAASAGHIPDALRGIRIDERSRRVFIELAERLRGEALQLKKKAGARDYSAARDAMSRITTACHECHRTFRGLPGMPKTPS